MSEYSGEVSLRVRFGKLAATLVVCILASSASASVSIQPIALSQEPLLGLPGNAIDQQNWTFDVNASGRIVFLGATDDSDSGGALRDGVYAIDHDATVPLLLQSDDVVAPDTDAVYSGFSLVRSANNGQVLFGGRFKPESGKIDGLNNEFLAVDDGTAKLLVAREGEPSDGALYPSPSGDIYFSQNIQGNSLFQIVNIDDDGNVAFQPGSNTSAFNADDDSPYLPGVAHVWTVSNQGNTGLAFHRNATLLPNGLRLKGFPNTRFVQNGAGQIAFGASLETAAGGSVPTSSDTALYVRDSNGAFVEKVRETSASTFDRIINLDTAFVQLDDSGEIFFYSQRDSFSDGCGLYTTADDGVFKRVAQLGSLFLYNITAEATEVVSPAKFLRGGLGFDVGAQGAAAVLLEVEQNDFPNAVRGSLLIYQGGQRTERYTPGDPVIGLDAGFAIDLDSADSTRAIEMNRNGWVAFTADAISGFRDTALLLSSPEGETFVVAIEDQEFNFDGQGGLTLTDIIDWRLDDTDTITIAARFLGGRSGLFRVNVQGDSIFTDRFEQ